MLSAVTSLKVNVRKSKMVPIGAVDNVHVLAGLLGCRVGNLTMSYLGMPLGVSLLLFGILYWRNLREDWQDGRNYICPKVVG